MLNPQLGIIQLLFLMLGLLIPAKQLLLHKMCFCNPVYQICKILFKACAEAELIINQHDQTLLCPKSTTGISVRFV